MSSKRYAARASAGRAEVARAAAELRWIHGHGGASSAHRAGSSVGARRGPPRPGPGRAGHRAACGHARVRRSLGRVV